MTDVPESEAPAQENTGIGLLGKHADVKIMILTYPPWYEFEKDYAFMFPSDRGNVAKPVRMTLGSLIIQARCGYTDREVVQ